MNMIRVWRIIWLLIWSLCLPISSLNSLHSFVQREKHTRASSRVIFERPTIVENAENADGFQCFGDGLHIIGGRSGDGWYASGDGGKTWSVIFDNNAGDFPDGDTVAVVLSDDGLTMHDFGYVSVVNDTDAKYSSFNSSNATYFGIGSDGNLRFERASTQITFRGLPEPASCGDSRHLYGCPFRLHGQGYVRLDNGTHVMSAIIWWGGKHGNPNPKLKKHSTSIVAFQSSDGLTWDYTGTIADAAHALGSQEGPNENDLSLLADGETIMCVMRLDAGDGQISRPFLPYARSISADGGRTWSHLTLLEGVGSARPRLLRLSGGQLVLAGGRSNTSRDIMLWLNEEGDGLDWMPHSVSYMHNLQMSGYTSLLATGSQSGLVVYPQRHGDAKRVFAMPFNID